MAVGCASPARNVGKYSPEGTERLLSMLRGEGRTAQRSPWAPPRTTLRQFVTALPPGPEFNVVDQGAAIEYLAVLDRALEDRSLSDEEIGALSRLAAAWGLDQKDVHASTCPMWREFAKLHGPTAASRRTSDEICCGSPNSSHSNNP